MKAEGKPGKETAAALGEISRFRLYVHDPDKALAAAERALSIVPGVLWIEISRAHALMFLDRREEALALYLAHKDDKSWQKAIAEDFAEFRKVNLTNPMMFEVEKELGISP
jgi:predicted Zn-dependent protease